MPLPRLVIGDKTLSSWSLRPWLLLRHFKVPFEEVALPLATPEFQARIAGYSPTRQVPVLWDDTLHVWDSLAICEYINERWLDGRGWTAAAGRPTWPYARRHALPRRKCIPVLQPCAANCR